MGEMIRRNILSLAAFFLSFFATKDSMAIPSFCDTSNLVKFFRDQYASGGIDTSKYKKMEDLEVAKMMASEVLVCEIHSRLNDLVHSYSIWLYFIEEKNEAYLIYEGGFSGADRFGFGPVNRK